MTEKGILRSIRDRVFNENACFLCGIELNDANNSDEHVFPKWILRKFDLWNRSLVLLDGTWIPYSRLVIPCCKKCNNEHLSDVEKAVERAAKKDCESIAALDQATLYLWMCKVFLGILFKELQTPKGRRPDAPEKVISLDHFKRNEMLLFWLQSVRLEKRFNGYTPGSVFVFPTIVPGDVQYQFDYFDLPSVPACALRLGSIGLVCHLLDNGLHRQVGSELRKKYGAIPLHPIQFRELGAMEFYVGELAEQECRIDVIESGADSVFTVRWHQPAGDRPQEPWDHHRYAGILSAILGFPKDRVFAPPKTTWTCLHDAQGSVIDMRGAKVSAGAQTRPLRGASN